MSSCLESSVNVVEGIVEKTEVMNESNPKILIDFSSASGLPLFKKLAMFTPSWTNGALFINNIDKLESLRPDNMRLDLCLGFGGMGGSIGTGTLDEMKNDYTALNMYSNFFVSHGVLPYWCYFATPYALQSKSTSKPWIDPPNDYNGWYQICYNIAKNLLDNDIEMFAHEIWNEPDFDIFFTGSFDDYINIYRYGSKGIYDADPDAVIGGLSSAYPDRRIQNGDLDKLLTTVINEDLPLDFISYHAYNANNVSPVSFVQQVRNSLEKYPELKTIRMHLNEYNLGLSEKVNSSYEAPAKTFEHLLALNAFTDLEVINWAMFLDATNVMSLVDTFGKRMPQYHALAFYNNMPYRRVAAESFSHVQAFASCDSNNAAAVIFNNTPTAETISLSLDNVPFDKGNISIYVIDEKRSNYKETGKDELELAFLAENVQLKDIYFDIDVSGFSTYMVMIDDGSGFSSLDTVESLGKFVRRDYYYDNRSNNCYAEFDRLSQTAYIGMGAKTQAKAATSVVYDNVDSNIEVFAEYSVSAGSGVCGYQISYHTAQGYTKSEFYRIAGSGDLPSFRWGEITETEKSAGEFVIIDIERSQPEGFDGRIRISFYTEDMPVYSYGTIKVRRAGK